MKGRKVAEDSVIERCISVEATDVGHQLIISYGKMCCFYHNCQNSSGSYHTACRVVVQCSTGDACLNHLCRVFGRAKLSGFLIRSRCNRDIALQGICFSSDVST